MNEPFSKICVASSVRNFDIGGTLVGDCRMIGTLIAGREAVVTAVFDQCYAQLCAMLGFASALPPRSQPPWR